MVHAIYILRLPLKMKLASAAALPASVRTTAVIIDNGTGCKKFVFQQYS